MDIYTKFKPTFLGLYDNEKLIGSISGHKSSHEDYRIRGIYILPKYRAKGLSKLLFDAIILQAKKENSTQIWSLPKKESFFSYKKSNFIQTTKWIETTYGLNCFAVKAI
jgi:GNAT superfamily N-acetyltransferase